MSALVPTAGLLSRLAPKVQRTEQFGVLPLLFIGKGIAAGLKFIGSPKGKEYLSKLGQTKGKAQHRYEKYRKAYEAEKDPKAKERWKRRMDRARGILDDWSLKEDLAKRGVLGRGPVLEHKRNLRASQWERADASGRKQIESDVASMDVELKKLYAEHQAREKAEVEQPHEGSRVQIGLDPSRAKGGPYARRVDITKAKRSGMGGMQFDVMAPPGPGRLVRIPFYPLSDGESWSGANGIEFPGDDPILNLTVPAGSLFARPLMMETERFDYGSYRILGLQTNEQYTYKTIGDIANAQLPFPATAIITLSRFSLYNGAELFLPDPIGEMPSSTYNILRSGLTATTARSLITGLAGSVARTQMPYNYLARRSRWFAGLRDHPVVSGTTRVQMVVSAFASFYNNVPVPNPGTGPALVGPMPVPIAPVNANANDLQIPFTCNIIAEMVSDRVYGDLVNPSPAARAGAQVKAAARELGTNIEGKEVIEVVSSRLLRE